MFGSTLGRLVSKHIEAELDALGAVSKEQGTNEPTYEPTGEDAHLARRCRECAILVAFPKTCRRLASNLATTALAETALAGDYQRARFVEPAGPEVERNRRAPN